MVAYQEQYMTPIKLILIETTKRAGVMIHFMRESKTKKSI